MSFDKNYNSSSSLYDYYNPISRLIPEISIDQIYQRTEQKSSHSFAPIASRSPSRSGTSSSGSSTAHPSSLPTASPPYLSHTTSSDFSRTSPSSLSGTSPRRFSNDSPSRFSPASPVQGLSSISPPYLARNSPPDFSSAGTSCFSTDSSIELPTASPPYFSHASPPGLSRGSPSGRSRASPPSLSRASPPGLSRASPLGFPHDNLELNFSTALNISNSNTTVSSPNGNITDRQPANSRYLNLAVAATDVETNRCRILRSYGNSNSAHESNGYSSPFVTSTNMLEHETIIPTDQIDIPSTSSAWHMVNVPPTRPPSHCSRNIHDVTQQRYCLTCSQPYCKDCCIGYHENHAHEDFMKYLQLTVDQGTDTLRNARTTLNMLQTDLEDVQLDAEMLDQKARQAAANVMSCIRRHISALEAREKELLNSIERARVVKFDSLKMKDEQLRNDKTRLTKVTYKLCNVLDACDLSSNPKELLAIKDMTMAEIKQNRRYRSTREESWISFTSLGNTLMHEIANLGNIQTSNPGPIGEGRAICGSNSSHLYLSYTPKIPKEIGRGRPVPGNSFPVIVGESTYNTVVQVIGDNGDVPDNLCRPWGITCDNRGHIIVADRSNNRIQIYREDGTFVMRFGSQGTGQGQFDRPAGIAVDSRQRIIIADKDNHRIQILQMDGTFVNSFGQKGHENGQFNYPWDVAVNSECRIAVSDTRNHRVQLFSPDGVFLCKYGYENTPNMWKYFDSPRGVCFTPDGSLIVSDFNNHTLVSIDSRFSSARTLTCEAVDNSNKPFLRPQGVVVDDKGNIIVADSRNHRIQVFNSSGRFLWKYGVHGTNMKEMDRPADIALLPDGKIAIIDFGNNRVLVLDRVIESAESM